MPDPEIPVVSVVELGILRGIEWDAADPATLVVTVTPTYSGCPATELIMTSIRDALAAAGVARVRIETRLAPAWTTDWMTPEARRKLARLRHRAARRRSRAVPRRSRSTCPASARCAARRRRAVPALRLDAARSCVSQFGSTACKAHYRCLDCLEPFDYFKPH